MAEPFVAGPRGNIPAREWKRLQELERKIAELERRLTALETA